ncbi:hypothetical protein, conserved [Leishmania shawi]|uniref:Uncharacterized protein n=1 Tax=Leishmania shawi TaxID=5680 RepID=A0ABR3EEA9_9TRYP
MRAGAHRGRPVAALPASPRRLTTDWATRSCRLRNSAPPCVRCELRLPHCVRTPHSSARLPTRRSNGRRPTGDAAPAFVVYTTRGAQEASAAPSPLLGSAFTVDSARLPTRRSNGRRPTGDAAPAFVVYTTRGAQEASAAPSPLLGSAFTVVEEKKGRLRRRLPLWPRQASRWLEKSIVTQPRELVLDECGGVTELIASLLQVLLPLHLRAHFSM